MIATFTALLFAHVLADFVFQTHWIAENKNKASGMLAHVVLVLVFAQAALGHVSSYELIALAGIHLVIDILKVGAPAGKLWPFLCDQGAHLASLVAVATYAPDLWQTGAWAACPSVVLHAMAVFAGVVIATRAGGFAIGLLMARYSREQTPVAGLPGGGRTIGLLERGLIFVLMLAGLAPSIGFLIAAKSILRFGAVSEDRGISEYVIIGTLASFGWAITVALATMTLREMLPPVEIAPLNH